MARILIIEDDRLLRRALRLALENSGHAVSEAENGAAGLKAQQTQPADLVITDLIMPEMEGIETIRLLRKGNPTLPILAMSGGGRGRPESYLDLAKQFGAASVLAKPFEHDEFCKAVARLLEKSKPAPTPPTAGKG